MRLPCDATLIVVDIRSALDDPQWVHSPNPGAQAAIAALLAAWRAEKLPIIHIRPDWVLPKSSHASGKAGRKLESGTDAEPGERIVATRGLSAFVDTALEQELDALGATTLVLCGVLRANSLEATARHAGDLGYRIFVVADACWAVDEPDLEEPRARDDPPAGLSGEYAEIVDCARTLKAAAMANVRLRRREQATQ